MHSNSLRCSSAALACQRGRAIWSLRVGTGLRRLALRVLRGVRPDGMRKTSASSNGACGKSSRFDSRARSRWWSIVVPRDSTPTAIPEPDSLAPWCAIAARSAVLQTLIDPRHAAALLDARQQLADHLGVRHVRRSSW